MKQMIILLLLFVSAFGAKLNQYLPPRPEADNIQFQPPALPNSANQFGASKVSGQSTGSFGQFPQKQQTGTFGQTNVNTVSEQSGQISTPFGFNTENLQSQSPSLSSNGYKQDESLGSKFEPQNTNSFEQFSNQRQDNSVVPSANGLSQPAGVFNGHFTSSTGPQLAPIGIIRSEINPDAGDGHYSYLYETENGITAQEEGFETNNGKSAQGSFSYTSPEGEIITLEYTADANGFVPRGSHVPEIPEAIARSIELNKAAEARGEYNEGSYRDEYNDESNGNKENAQLNSVQDPNAYGYQKSELTRNNNFSNQGTLTAEGNNQISPFGQQNKVISSINGVPKTFGQQNYESLTPFEQKGTQQLLFPFGQQNNGPKTSFEQNSKQLNPFGQQNNVPSTSFVSQNEAPSSYYGNNYNTRTLGQQKNEPEISFERNNNDYQYSTAGNTKVGEQQLTPFGQQNNAPSTSFASQNNEPEISNKFAPNYEASGITFSANNFSLQKNGPKRPSGQYEGTVQDNQGGYKY
ncbi:type-2 histone deacetylase 1-like [Diorhabda carinulata]|uniref:type-2 histone deacetylase 1-like n=1 Tax=Diorhabda carinulata TaxID=1163345 RepID=UPI0025A2B1D0|nr:type-2 histone deacetylase 1-like [Diorhabda carinulata]